MFSCRKNHTVILPHRATVIILVLLLFAGTNLFGETNLRRGFRDLQLGLSYEKTQDILISDSGFSYRGDPDLSISLSTSESIIDTPGRGFIERAVLQFADDTLVGISLYLSQATLDYFRLFEQLRSRYGEADDLNPEWSKWEDSTTRILLERPLTVRYFDLSYLNRIGEERSVQEAIQSQRREDFLNEF